MRHILCLYCLHTAHSGEPHTSKGRNRRLAEREQLQVWPHYTVLDADTLANVVRVCSGYINSIHERGNCILCGKEQQKYTHASKCCMITLR